MAQAYPLIGRFEGVEAFQARLAELGLDLPCDDRILPAPESPLASSLEVSGLKVGNRFCVHPMEGWDGTAEGLPTPDTERRWERFGLSGAKLVWGGEAVAVRHDGRANPNQLLLNEQTREAIGALRTRLVQLHEEHYGASDDLVVGLQLTHSGRFCRPNRKDALEPRILYHHPVLDARFGIDDSYPVLSDDEIREYIADFHRAARTAYELGYQFVDVKHCHGYLGHEFLSAFDRPGPYGGSFENRTRFLREIVEGIHQVAPDLRIGVRLSAFDFVPFQPDPDYQDESGRLGPGVPVGADQVPYPGFGADRRNPLAMDLGEPQQFLQLLADLGVHLVNLTAGSPYYNPHIQRPAYYPPSDGYQPPEDPLVGVARQVQAVRELRAVAPRELVLVGTGYSYLQEYLPHVAQAVVREGWVDLVGVGRMVLSYPDLPADCLRLGELRKKLICRTFSDCTTAPRNGLKSGCYPLDDYYRRAPERKVLRQIKRD